MKIVLYSPNQVLATSVLGGPLAAIFALKSNFDALGNQEGANLVIRWGIAFVVAMLCLLPFLPQDFPQMVLPLAYSFAARGICEALQLSREQIAGDERYEFIPTNRLVTHSLSAMLVFLLVTLLWFGTLDHYGIIQLPEPSTSTPSL